MKITWIVSGEICRRRLSEVIYEEFSDGILEKVSKRRNSEFYRKPLGKKSMENFSNESLKVILGKSTIFF